ncbi:MAG: GGDEF domain-containing protein [Lachnospiraceae bacterium]|nr:GGDEF domain-containing protein [Lachnospiraceae bacterium]
MRRRIGLIVGEQGNDYSIALSKGIFEEAKKLDYDIFIFSNFGTYDHNIVLYGEGESSVYKIPNIDSFDGFIIDETLFNIEKMNEAVYSYFDKNANCPVISLKKRSNRFYDLLLGDRQAMKEITNHFIKDHGFTKICHMTGRWELQDARDRYLGYEEAMQEAGLDISDDMIFYGDYWYNKAADAVDHFTHGGKDLPQAIVCANDYMAAAICSELEKRGIRIPEDVCVSGYDNEEEGRCQTTPITTFDPDISRFGRTAMNILHKAIEGGSAPKITYIPSTMLLRESCGCGHCKEQDTLEFRLKKMTRYYYGIDMSVYMYNGYQIAFDEDDIFSNADNYFKYNFASYAYICLCSDALDSVHRPVELVNEYTDKMILKRVFYMDKNMSYESPDITFDRKDILPVQLFDTKEPMMYFINPIHAQNKCYGYMVSIYDADEWPYHFTQSYVSALGNALDDFNVHNEYMNMEEIKAMYLTDALTGINNRRGYEQNMLLILDRANRREIYLSVASIDMDGLKTINDTYGHEAGDNCLKALGSALSKVVSPDETVARYGGDEFAAILVSRDPERHMTFESDLQKAIDEENKLMNKPYSLHASVGLTHVGAGGCKSLIPYMQRADKLMYENKAKYKASLKS